MIFIDKIKNIFKPKNDYEQLKSKKLKSSLALKEPIQTYNRKENKWSKMFYRDNSQKNIMNNSLKNRG